MAVYLDNAATTPVAPEVVEVMYSALKDTFGNPSSSHSFGRSTKALIETARRSIAKHLNCQPSELIFTSGGTEADNMAIQSAIQELGVNRILTSSLEHHAVGHTADALPKAIEVIRIEVDGQGHINFAQLEELLQEDKKTLVSLMHANNEIGTKIDLHKVSGLCRKYNAYFHSDTVQTMGHYRFDLRDLDIDFITCAAHKLHGPKGIGFLYVNKNISAGPIIHGGAQERGLRGGTENVPGIVGLAKALDLAHENMEAHQEHVQGLKSYMIAQLREIFDDVEFHGDIDPKRSLYTVLNVCFPKNEKSSMLLFTLDLKGVAVSGGSACSSGASVGSHVLQGIGADMTRPNARFSFSRYTTKEDIDFALEQVRSCYSKTLV
jgi:cysteine desulfurase